MKQEVINTPDFRYFDDGSQERITPPVNRFAGTTIEQLLECDAATLDAMTDAELDAFFAESLKICPVVTMMEPVGDAQPRQTTSLRGARGGQAVKRHTTAKPPQTMEPQFALAKQMSKADVLRAKNEALQRLMEGL